MNKHVAFDPPPEPSPSSNKVGEQLLASGRIKGADLARVRHHQLISNTNFDESAVALGLVSQEDVSLAVAAARFGNEQDEGLSPDLVCAKAPDHPLAVAIYRMRTSLFLAHKGNPGPMVIAVVGAQRAEGRTVLASNLAISFAQVGARTALVDADLRHGRIHTLFNLTNQNGFADVLQDRRFADESIAIMKSDGLAVMTSGRCMQPERLLSPARIQGVFESVCEGRDVVIVDTPAWGSGADAELIAAEASMALMVTRLKSSSLRAVTEMANALRRSATKTMAVPLQ